jgi:DNA-binding LacI/PurR family transcriptional regulator
MFLSMLSLREFAKLAGVSHVTVSRVFSGRGHVSESTQKKVRELAEKHNFSPNPILSQFYRRVRRGEKSNYRGTIGWLNCSAGKEDYHKEPTIRRFHEGAKKRAGEIGMGLEPFWMLDPDMPMKRLADIIEARGIVCLILLSLTSWKNLQAFPFERFITVKIGGTPVRQSGVINLVGDYNHGIQLLFERLGALGYQRIGLCVSKGFVSSTRNEALAFYDLMQRDLPARRHLKPLIYSEIRPETATVQPWLEKERPDVIICNDILMEKRLKELGLSVPGDIGLAHTHVSEDVQDWSGINIHDRQFGALAVESAANASALVQESRSPLIRHVIVEPHWVQGRTTRQPGR